jgi:pimeloyl-ACP methyl ester carboxylesterase
MADDLKAIIDGLDLRNIVLVGFSMGGGEVVRYLNRHGSERIDKIALISSVTPFLLKTHDNPDGVDGSVFADMMREMKEDRIAFLDEFGKKLFSATLMNHPVSTPLLEYYACLLRWRSQELPNNAQYHFPKVIFGMISQTLIYLP